MKKERNMNEKSKNPLKDIEDVIDGKKKVFKLDDGHDKPIYTKAKKEKK